METAMDGQATAIILAGGQGTRIRALYPETPKLLIPVAGEPFVEWILRHLASQGIERVVISLGHLADVAIDYFRRRRSDQLNIETVVENQPLGTGGGFLAAACRAPSADPFVVVNGDSLVLADYVAAWSALEDPDIDG